MLPILFEEGSKVTDWQRNGIGTLRDALTCNVVENLEGVFELEMTYPTKGWKADEIKVGRQLKVQSRYFASPEELGKDVKQGAGDPYGFGFFAMLGWAYQPFIIYSIDYSLEGILQIKAYHYTYRIKEWSTNVPKWGYGYMALNNDKTFTISQDTPAHFFYWLVRYYQGINSRGNTISVPSELNFRDANNSAITNAQDQWWCQWKVGEFEFVQCIMPDKPKYPWTHPEADLSNKGQRLVEVPETNLAALLLGDQDDSLRNVYDLEILRDRNRIILQNKRSMKEIGVNPLFIRYGKDLLGFKLKVDNSAIYTHIRPYVRFTMEKISSPEHPNENRDDERSYVYPLVADGTKYKGGLFPLEESASFFNVLELDVTPYVDGNNYKWAASGAIKPEKGFDDKGFPIINLDAIVDAQPWIILGVKRYLASNSPNYSKLEADVNFLHLRDVQETRHLRNLQTARLGDPVMIDHEALGYRVYSKVSETNFNVLAEKYNSIKLESHVIPVPKLG